MTVAGADRLPLGRLTRGAALLQAARARAEATDASRRAARLADKLIEAEALLARLHGGVIRFDKRDLISLRR